MRLLYAISVLCLLLASMPGELRAEQNAERAAEGANVQLESSLNPYYSNVGLFMGLTDTPIPEVGEKSELQIYKDLLLGSYIPRFLVLEVSLYPMPVLGVLTRKHAGGFYDDSEVLEDLNLVRAVTAGFEEPLAVSLFLGDVVHFSRPGGEETSGNKGYMGYLFSAGSQHIKDNRLVEDDWYEVEWKIKGDRVVPRGSLHWSFRVGTKMHGNRDIRDVVYFSIRRSRIDFVASAGSLLKNSGFEYTYAMDNSGFDPVSHYFFVDKKWPMKSAKAALTLALGFIWDSERKYSGSLGEEDEGDNFQLVIRPNIEF
jgi:hypothetical protein